MYPVPGMVFSPPNRIGWDVACVRAIDGSDWSTAYHDVVIAIIENGLHDQPLP